MIYSPPTQSLEYHSTCVFWIVLKPKEYLEVQHRKEAKIDNTIRMFDIRTSLHFVTKEIEIPYIAIATIMFLFFGISKARLGFAEKKAWCTASTQAYILFIKIIQSIWHYQTNMCQQDRDSPRRKISSCWRMSAGRMRMAFCEINRNSTEKWCQAVIVVTNDGWRLV